MKKVKTLLVTAVAALSLSACSFQDVIDWTKNTGGQVGGFFTSLLEKVGLKKKEEKKEEPCKHEDKNHDGTCDLCGETGLEVVHADENHDHKCDVCGLEMSAHKDEDNDFKCDYCGAELATVGVRLDTSDAKLLFAKGEQFSSDGLKVIATSEVGSERELTFTTSEPDMSKVGDQEVVVTYGEGENEKASYSINISYWSEADLEILESETLLGYYGGIALPFMAGRNMKVVAEKHTEEGKEVLDSWKITADNITSEAYLEYYNELKSISAVVGEADPLTFEFNKVMPFQGTTFEGFHGLSNVNVLSLAPTHIDSDGDVARRFVEDELYILGVNSDGQLVIETRIINAMLDGLFGPGTLDGLSIYYAAQINPYLAKILGWYYSELSELSFVYPKVNAYINLINLATFFPLSEGLDQYDLAWLIQYPMTTQADYDAYVADLVANGYEKVEYEDGSVSYVFENELCGRLEFVPEYEPDLGTLTDGTQLSGISTYFYFNAPEEYLNHLSLEVWDLEEILGQEFEINYDYYEDLEFIIATTSFDAENYASSEKLAISIARALLAEGYEMASELKFNDNYKQYVFTMVNSSASFTFYVDEEVTDGAYGVECYIGDFDGELEYSNAELALISFYSDFTESAPLYSVDYSPITDEQTKQDYFVTTVSKADAECSSDKLEEEVEALLESLGDSFKLASSEAGESEGVWTAEFQDVANSVKVLVEASTVAEEGYVFILQFIDFRFATPQSVAEDFVLAATGASPIEGAIVEQDGTFKYTSTVSGEFESLEAVAAEFASDLPDTFELISSEAGASEGTWVQVYEFASAKVRATISVAQGEENYSVSLLTEYIFPELPIDDIVSFFEEAGIDDVTIPGYELSNVDTKIEADDSWEGYFDIYLTGSSHEEMEDYKDALVLAGWTVVGENNGDYRLQFGETNAFVDLLDYEDYINVSFFVQKDPMTPEEALTEFASYFGQTIDEVESGVYGMGAAYAYNEQKGNTASGLMSYVDDIFGYVLTEFSALGNWAEEDGTYSLNFMNSANTVVQVYVWEETVYVKDGQIVPEGTEDAVETKVVYVEAYSFTYTPQA